MNANQMKDMAAFAVKRATKKKGVTFGGIGALVSKMNAAPAGKGGQHAELPTRSHKAPASGSFANGAPGDLGRGKGSAMTGAEANGSPGSLGRGADPKKVKGSFGNGAPKDLGKKR